MKKLYLFYLGVLNFAIVWVLTPSLFVNCANSSVAPTGGIKDTIPPVLIKTVPEFHSSEFSGKDLVFTFNEYVHLKDQNKHFTISPPPSKKPNVRIKKKSVVVNFAEPLDSSTTYYVDFGVSVVDVNEDNPAEALNFLFSTGKQLDTMVFLGHVVDAFTLDPQEGIFAFLYESNSDSIPYLKNPSALGRTDKYGDFQIKGLKGIDYKLVIIGDANNNFRYDEGSEKIAFSDSLIKPLRLGERDTVFFEDLPIYNLFTQLPNRQILLSKKRLEERKVELIFSAPEPNIQKFIFEGYNSNDYIEERSILGDTLRYWFTSKEVADTIFGNIIYLKSDSLNQLRPDTIDLKLYVEKKVPAKKSKPQKGKEEEEEEEVPNLNLKFGASPVGIILNNLIINSDTPIKHIQKDKIELLEYDLEGKEKKSIDFDLEQDTTLYRTYKLKADWKEAIKYELTLFPASFIDIYSVANDTIKKTLEMPRSDRYGSLQLSFANVSNNCIVQIVKDKKVSFEKNVSEDSDVSFPYLEPGKYMVRLINDTNNNKRWDTGNYLKREQPEKVVYVIFDDGENLINIKANWEEKHAMDLSGIFTLK